MSLNLISTGSDEYLSAAASRTAFPCTLVCWFRIDGTSVEDGQDFLTIADANGSDFLQLQYWNPDGLLYAGGEGSNGFEEAASTASATLNVFQHAAAVFAAADDRTVYLNGGNAGNTTSDMGALSGIDNTLIGALSVESGFGSFVDGDLADAALWDVALNAAEVAALAKGFSPVLIRPQNLVFYAPLVRDPWNDIVGALTLTVNGTPTANTHFPSLRPSAQILQFPPVAAASVDLILPPRLHSEAVHRAASY